MWVAAVVATMAAIAGAAALVLLGGGSDGADRLAAAPAPAPRPPEPRKAEEERSPRPRPQVVEAIGPGEPAGGEEQVEVPESDPPLSAEEEDGPSPGAQSDEEIQAELDELRETVPFGSKGAKLEKGGVATPPVDAPTEVRQIIAAGNQIARAPYKWGGGHGRWLDKGYDCSGSVSFALASAGLMDAPLASGPFMRWGARGRGKWVTIFANEGHMFMVVAGLRFDTSGRARTGSRWQSDMRSPAGYTLRHPPGL
jgi:cell wall-associated NlpC family hydrolase